jgi:hypothetical protein
MIILYRLKQSKIKKNKEEQLEKSGADKKYKLEEITTFLKKIDDEEVKNDTQYDQFRDLMNEKTIPKDDERYTIGNYHNAGDQ